LSFRLDLQGFVQAPRAEACQIDGHIGEAELTKTVDHSCSEIGIQEPRQVGDGNLDPGNAVVVPQAQLPEPALVEEPLAFSYLCQAF
jgi:hypothetical protein